MKETCFLEAQIPDWLGHRLEGVKSLFPDMSDGIFFCLLIDQGCTSMIELYEKRGDE